MPDVFNSQFGYDIYMQKYSKDRKEGWVDTCRRVVDNVIADRLPNEVKNAILQAMVSRKFMPAGRYLYSAGREIHMTNNCFTLRAEDTREGWSTLLHDASSMLLMGGGVGVDYSAVRAKGSVIRRTGGEATGPLSLMRMLDYAGEGIMQGGQRRSALWAGLSWSHGDIFDFLKCKNHSESLKLSMILTSLTLLMTLHMQNIQWLKKYGYKTHVKHSKQRSQDGRLILARIRSHLETHVVS